MTSGGADPKEMPVSPPSVAQIQLRRKVLALSWADQVLPSLGSLASPSRGASAADDKAIRDMMADMVVKTRGRELDELRRQFEGEFEAFSAFHASPAAKALVSVYAAMSKESAGDAAKQGILMQSTLLHSVEIHRPAWKAAYEAGRTKQAVVK
jgi:hypothetical protein